MDLKEPRLQKQKDIDLLKSNNKQIDLSVVD